ncbi:MAG: diguanylate cyclase [Planctomycetes bacterium]|nr:diguanylate cyclase [Planctomycetota bacterium]
MQEKQFEELKLTGSLPSPTGVGLAILQLTQTEDFTIADLSRSLQADPTLTGRILKLANSAAHSGTRTVTTVQDACVRLGAQNVRNLALGFTLVSGHRSGRCKAFDHDLYWSQSLALAVAAQSLATRGGKIKPGEAFTCALLVHIGRLALAAIHPDRYAVVLEKHGAGSMDELALLEDEAFGSDHRELAEAMLADWRLPESFAWTALVFDRGQALEDRRDDGANDLAKLVRAAWNLVPALSSLETTEASACKRAFAAAESVRNELGWTTEEFDRVFSSIAQDYIDWGKLMGLPVPRALGYDSLARKAAEVRVDAAAPTAETKIMPARSVRPIEAANATGGLRVLAVDDDPVMLKLMSFHLARAGHTLFTATGGRQALSLALEHAPQVVVTDWVMPDGDGVEFVRALRRSAQGKKVQVIMLTGREEEGRLLEAFEAGADEYLPKPFNPQILIARVRAGQRTVQMYEQIERDREERDQQLAQLAVLTRKLQAAALTDPLTELPNRRFAMQHLDQEIARAATSALPVSVIMIDIDKFKAVNDAYGHDTGDVVLKEVAQLLRRSVRTGDRVCRIGGEEFYVILPRTDLAGAVLVAERARVACETNVIRKGDFTGAVTISLGVAELDPARPSVDALIKTADVRVYGAKHAGRNRVVSTGEVPASTAIQRKAG